jgi:hypothetical protein
MQDEILKLKKQGLSYRQIAKELNITLAKVAYYACPTGKEKALARYRKFQRSIKQQLVEFKGGKCELCGYNKSLAALDFHHLDPTQKIFTISRRVTADLDSLKAEVSKCSLLCANCHREKHEDSQDISQS